MSSKRPALLTQLERYKLCATGHIGEVALRKYLRGDSVRALTKYRLQLAVTSLGLEHKFPELFEQALAGGDRASIPNAGDRE
ncbi:MAG: hypothetical protein K0R38_5023 [Polyangiaceae bacterium]|jgi:hypothetical protein|nr:hypothetical protein [Polyangiaceae bacterium]